MHRYRRKAHRYDCRSLGPAPRLANVARTAPGPSFSCVAHTARDIGASLWLTMITARSAAVCRSLFASARNQAASDSTGSERRRTWSSRAGRPNTRTSRRYRRVSRSFQAPRPRESQAGCSPSRHRFDAVGISGTNMRLMDAKGSVLPPESRSGPGSRETLRLRERSARREALRPSREQWSKRGFGRRASGR